MRLRFIRKANEVRTEKICRENKHRQGSLSGLKDHVDDWLPLAEHVVDWDFKLARVLSFKPETSKHCGQRDLGHLLHECLAEADAHAAQEWTE